MKHFGKAIQHRAIPFKLVSVKIYSRAFFRNSKESPECISQYCPNTGVQIARYGKIIISYSRTDKALGQHPPPCSSRDLDLVFFCITADRADNSSILCAWNIGKHPRLQCAVPFRIGNIDHKVVCISQVKINIIIKEADLRQSLIGKNYSFHFASSLSLYIVISK